MQFLNIELPGLIYYLLCIEQFDLTFIFIDRRRHGQHVQLAVLCPLDRDWVILHAQPGSRRSKWVRQYTENRGRMCACLFLNTQFCA